MFINVFEDVLVILSPCCCASNGRILFIRLLQQIEVMKKSKVAIFIDGSNLYHDLRKNFGNAGLDFGKFAQFLGGKDKIVVVYYYSAPLNQNDDPEAYKSQQKFFSALDKISHFQVKLGRLEKRQGGQTVEKGVDVRMAVDIVTHAYSNIYDKAIIVSGDSDFVPAIMAAQDFGKKVTNVCFPKTKSYHLNQVCDETITIEETEFKNMKWKH